MSGIDTVYQYVQDDVKRGDMQAIIWRRIHRTILMAHRIDQWKKDVVEQIYTFEVPGTAVIPAQPAVTGANALFMNFFGQINTTINVQEIDTTQLARYRKIYYLRKFATVDIWGNAIYDPTTGQQGTVQGGDLTERSADKMCDAYNFDIDDVYYWSGSDIKIRSSTPLSKVYLGYFADPITTPNCQILDQFRIYASWIVDNYPNLIASYTKQRIFSDIGKDTEKNDAKEEYAQELATFQAGNISLSVSR